MTTGRINQVSILSNRVSRAAPEDATHAPRLTLPSRARVIDWMCVCLGTPYRLISPEIAPTRLKAPFPKPSSEVLPGSTNAPEAASEFT
jgi:hypothetical protein|eukprot:31380-Pelagococcus_subviridis.AAC.1